MSEPDVVVVGAGPAGLAAAAGLQRAGISTVVLEQADAIGPSWRGRYDRFRLNTSRWSSKLPGSRWERGTGMFPSRDQMVSYLEQYAARKELDVRVGTRVGTRGWVLQTPAREFRARPVVVATGYDHPPFIPDWPGRGRFGGQLLHAGEYRNAEPFRGKDTLVVGPGCSGMEIAYDLALED